MEQIKECAVSPTFKHSFTLSTACDHCGAQAIIVDGEVFYCPTPKGQEYHAADQPRVLFWGGRGSGKSFTGRMDAHMRALATPGFKYCILRRTFPELEKSHLIDIGREMNTLGGRYLAGTHVAHYHNGSVGFFSHCSTQQDVLNLLSSEFHLMFFDEISTFEWEMFTKLSASCRVPEKMREQYGIRALVRAATNPLGCSAEQVNRYWVTKEVDDDENYKPEDWHQIKANIEDNPYLNKEEYLKQFVGNPLHVRKAWIDGEFSLENALFEVRQTKNGEPYHYVPYIDLDGIVKNAQIYRAFDMGYFPDPAVCLWIAHLGHRYIVFHEKLWFKTVISDIAADIKAEDEKLGITRVAITYCDPTLDIKTGQDVHTMKDIFEMNGISMESSINNREHFAHAIHTALSEVAEPADPEIGKLEVPRLQIYTRNKIGCYYLAKTLPLQKYDEKHPLKLADHPQDHATVALAYFLISSGSMEKSNMSTPAKIRRWMQPKIDKLAYRFL